MLEYLELMLSLTDLSLEELTHKLVMLIALVSAQRAHAISLLDLSNMVSGKSS